MHLLHSRQTPPWLPTCTAAPKHGPHAWLQSPTPPVSPALTVHADRQPPHLTPSSHVPPGGSTLHDHCRPIAFAVIPSSCQYVTFVSHVVHHPLALTRGGWVPPHHPRRTSTSTPLTPLLPVHIDGLSLSLSTVPIGSQPHSYMSPHRLHRTSPSTSVPPPCTFRWLSPAWRMLTPPSSAYHCNHRRSTVLTPDLHPQHPRSPHTSQHPHLACLCPHRLQWFSPLAVLHDLTILSVPCPPYPNLPHASKHPRLSHPHTDRLTCFSPVAVRHPLTFLDIHRPPYPKPPTPLDIQTWLVHTPTVSSGSHPWRYVPPHNCHCTSPSTSSTWVALAFLLCHPHDSDTVIPPSLALHPVHLGCCCPSSLSFLHT